jgi:hypothetical protein
MPAESNDHRAHHDEADRHAHGRVPVLLSIAIAILIVAGLIALRALDPGMR